MKKRALVDRIVATLGASLAEYERSAREAQAGATDPQNKAENKYDTRGLEASYLARGQANQALETIQAKQRYESTPVRDFAPGEAADVGALVELERAGERTSYFLGAWAGGTEVICDGREVVVVTPVSPMGRALLGRKLGDVVPLGREKFVVVRVA